MEHNDSRDTVVDSISEGKRRFQAAFGELLRFGKAFGVPGKDTIRGRLRVMGREDIARLLQERFPDKPEYHLKPRVMTMYLSGNAAVSSRNPPDKKADALEALLAVLMVEAGVNAIPDSDLLDQDQSGSAAQLKAEFIATYKELTRLAKIYGVQGKKGNGGRRWRLAKSDVCRLLSERNASDTGKRLALSELTRFLSGNGRTPSKHRVDGIKELLATTRLAIARAEQAGIDMGQVAREGMTLWEFLGQNQPELKKVDPEDFTHDDCNNATDNGDNRG